VAAIRARPDEARPEYGPLRAQLQKIRNANRRQDVSVERLFTLVPARENSNMVEYGVDAEERFEFVHHAGDIYTRDGAPVSIGIEGIDKLADRLERFQAGYNAAFAPVRDGSGKLIAELGIVGALAPSSTLHQVGPQILFSFGLTMVLALVVAMALSWQVTQPLNHLRRAIESIGKGDLSATVRTGMTGEFGQLAASINEMADGLRERDTIKRAFSGYLSRQMLDIVLASGQTAALKGERRRVTVLFADIRGFTAISEGLRPEEVVEVLSEVFDRMVDVVLRNHGTIDKFLGDGMMVIFGAPLDDPYQEEHAITAALEMQSELQVLADKRAAEGRRPVRNGHRHQLR
jgi:adenylate cyclase